MIKKVLFGLLVWSNLTCFASEAEFLRKEKTRVLELLLLEDAANAHMPPHPSLLEDTPKAKADLAEYRARTSRPRKTYAELEQEAERIARETLDKRRQSQRHMPQRVLTPAEALHDMQVVGKLLEGQFKDTADFNRQKNTLSDGGKKLLEEGMQFKVLGVYHKSQQKKNCAIQ